MLLARAVTITEEAAPEKVIPIRPVPSDEPDDPRCTDARVSSTDDHHDTKPAEAACTARRQDRTGALSDDTSTPKPPSPQATIGTQTDETNQPQIETLLEKETPPLPIETTRDGPDKPKDSRTQCKGWRRVDRETPNGPEPEFEDNLWATLPFAEATWRPTYRMRAVISTDDVDP